MSDQSNNAIIQKIIKLLAVSSSTTFAEEAATAASMAQALMTQYNLDIASLEKASGVSEGKREKSSVDGAFYKYTRDLYATVARLNFCTHWIAEEVRMKKHGTIWKQMGSPPEGRKHTVKVHRLIGRTVNIASTRVMCEYLVQAIERILKEHIEANMGEDFSSNYKMSFREGAAQNLVDRIEEQRAKEEAERQRKAREEKARTSHPGAAPSATGTALTLTDYKESEEAANYDFQHGPGAWARKLARQAHWQNIWKMECEAEECLAIFHPDIAEKERKENEARWAKESRRYRGSSGPKEKAKNWSAYRAGDKAAADISLNQQIDKKTTKSIR